MRIVQADKMSVVDSWIRPVELWAISPAYVVGDRYAAYLKGRGMYVIG